MTPSSRLKFLHLLPAALVFLCAVPAQASGFRAPGPEDRLHAVSVFFGEGTEDNFSDVVENFFIVDKTDDNVVSAAASRLLGWYGTSLSFEAELMYAWHFGREDYHEIGTAAYARWHRFPWNDYLATTFAVGMGPSYTSRYPELERQPDGSRSRVLNQFNLQATFALPAHPETSLVTRLQHRSGVFGAFNGVTDASNFISVGLRHEF
ncbi:MAG: hypothetical protein Q7U42_00850 [Parvibaculum sp.]|nr:hypothetical protein [Parvibaculum sp.]